MADVKEYAYYVKGNRLALVQKDVDASLIDNKYTPNYEAEWTSPTKDVAGGLQIECALIPKAKSGREITDESDELDIPRALGEALASYLKYKTFQEMGKLDYAQYWLKEYERLCSESFDGKVIGLRKVMTDNFKVI